jgi:hypothetical protein
MLALHCSTAARTQQASLLPALSATAQQAACSCKLHSQGSVSAALCLSAGLAAACAPALLCCHLSQLLSTRGSASGFNGNQPAQHIDVATFSSATCRVRVPRALLTTQVLTHLQIALQFSNVHAVCGQLRPWLLQDPSHQLNIAALSCISVLCQVRARCTRSRATSELARSTH